MASGGTFNGSKAGFKGDFQVGQAFQYWIGKQYKFSTFYHPYVKTFMKQLNRYGVGGLLAPSPEGEEPYLVRQRLGEEKDHWYFNQGGSLGYGPTDVVEEPRPKEDVDFSPGGAYSSYNWELFFHVPFLIADRLSRNQRFEEAQAWFHYVFDPTESTGGPVPRRFWKVRPFYDLYYKDKEDATAKPVNELMMLLDPNKNLDPDMKQVKMDLENQIDQWQKHPFNPHLIARLRPVAYQKAFVLKYLDNLIAWGDQLFRRDTLESINEATQLYILAAQLLGRRPERVQVREPDPFTFNQLKDKGLDALSNVLVKIEDELEEATGSETTSNWDDSPPVALPSLFFCIPPNEKLLGYWDTVVDRLFKIRHCMNIEGVVRQLPLFEPPIDPALLVKAVAAGVDVGSALNNLFAPLPHHRFQVLAQKATELCADVRTLGGALLAALEKRDAEALALLRSGHEIQLLKAIKDVKRQQVDEAKETLEGLNRAKIVTKRRYDYYKLNYDQNLNASEKLHLSKLESAHAYQMKAHDRDLDAKFIATLPNFDFGTSGISSPFVNVSFGGSQLGAARQYDAQALSMLAAVDNHKATMASIQGGFDRRRDDWKFQYELAEKELTQIDKQILAAQIRLAITENELKNHDMQVENAKEVDTFMRDKYTNRELYDWMVSQIAALYFQSYQMAYDLAKRAERAWQFELASPSTTFIQFGYWDSLKKGLLAGERLHYDLKRMEVAYLDKNKREYEITKNISLATFDPTALIALKVKGECEVDLPEALFDVDCPGHYLRRIKSVSLSIPCVVGPYTPVHCTLTLLKHSTRKDSTLLGDKYGREPAVNDADTRFMDSLGAIQSVVTSTALNDSGTFEQNLRDERYLPFEGAGVISTWRLELPKEFRQFDYDTISDVILHFRYTAREGGGILQGAAVAALKTAIKDQEAATKPDGMPLTRVFNARQEFSSDWHRFLHPADGQTQELPLPLKSDRFPFVFRKGTFEIRRVDVYLVPTNVGTDPTATPPSFPLFLAPPSNPQDPFEINLVSDSAFGGILRGPSPLVLANNPVVFANNSASSDHWTLSVVPAKLPLSPDGSGLIIGAAPNRRLNPNAVKDLFVAVYYTVVMPENGGQ